MLDANGNLTMQVIMLYTEDKLTALDRKTVDAFAAEDEMSRDALDGFAITGNTSKTRQKLNEINSEIQKLSGAKATATLLSSEDSQFSYQKLAAAVALLVVVGGTTWFIAQKLTTPELAENASEQLTEEEITLANELDSDSTVMTGTTLDKTIVAAESPLPKVDTKEREDLPKPTETVVKSKVEELATASDMSNDESVAEDSKQTESAKGAKIEVQETKKDESAAGNIDNSGNSVSKNVVSANRKEEDQQAARTVAMESADYAQPQQETFEPQAENASAKYPGGDLKMYKFIERKKNYTEAMRSQGLSGSVTVTFDIESDGRVSNVLVKNSANGLLDADAIRVVRSMPTWTPAYENGTPVRSSRSVVIKYGEKSE
jgi:TonB family protein